MKGTWSFCFIISILRKKLNLQFRSLPHLNIYTFIHVRVGTHTTHTFINTKSTWSREKKIWVQVLTPPLNLAHQLWINFFIFLWASVSPTNGKWHLPPKGKIQERTIKNPLWALELCKHSEVKTVGTETLGPHSPNYPFPRIFKMLTKQ